MRRITLLVLVMLAACGDRNGDRPTAGPGTEGQEVGVSTVQVARSAQGMVVAAHPLAAHAGARILSAGGNAADAAAAASFALAVVEPSMSGLGGRVQVLLHSPGGDFMGIDGTTQVPASFDPETMEPTDRGHTMIAVPGMVAGVSRLLAEHGTMELADVMAPAIEYAERGFRLTDAEASRIASVMEPIAASEGARTTFLRPDGSPFRGGDTFVQSDLAATLRAIAQGGPEVFYTGDVARRIAEDMRERGGSVTLEDLAAYRAEDAEVVRGSYRGHDLVATYVPAGGAIAIEVLQIMETVPLEGASEGEWVSVVGQALALGFEDYYTPMSPPEETALVLTSKEWARERARSLGVPATMTPASAGGMDDGHTSHLTVADRNGMVVALTQSLGPTMGSRVVTPGLGFLYAATMGYLEKPLHAGERASSAITPLMVSRGGVPVAALGAAGGLRILSAVVQTVGRLVDGGLSLEVAVASPRVHARAGSPWEIEDRDGARFGDDVEAVLDALTIDWKGNPSASSFGRVHAVGYDEETGEWVGVADPRWGGAAAVPVAMTTTSSGGRP